MQSLLLWMLNRADVFGHSSTLLLPLALLLLLLLLLLPLPLLLYYQFSGHEFREEIW